MRDFVVLTFIFLSAPLALFSPFYGIMVWHMISFLNPHRFAWGIAYSFPVAYMIGIPTLLGAFFTKETTKKIFTRETIIMMIMLLWFCVTLYHASEVPFLAGHVVPGTKKLIRIAKVMLMTFATLYLVNTRQKLRWLLLLVACSFIFLDAKGAIWGLFTGGENRVFGPEDSFIEDNNAFALASNMVLPLMFFLAWDEEKRWLRYLLRFGAGCAAIATVLTYSRGGLLGLLVVLTAIAIKAQKKLAGFTLLVLALIGMIAYSPQKWQARMEGFLEGNVDSSAEQRLITWGVGFKIVQNYPILGGGFEVYPDVTVFQQYKPREMPGGRLSAGPHSAYMEMVGEHGIPGLLLFITLIISTMLTLRKTLRRSRKDPEGRWARVTANALQIGILGFMVSGAFLEFANFDLWYLYVVCANLLDILYTRELAERAANVPHPVDTSQILGTTGDSSEEVYA